MSKTVKTSLNGKTELSIPYRFVCSACGKQNDKLYTETVLATFTRSGRYEGAVADPMFRQGLENQLARNAQDTLRRREEELASFTARVREGRLLEPVQGPAGKYIPTLPYDGACAFCGRRQPWDLRALQKQIPPMQIPEPPKWKRIARIAALILMLPAALGLLLLAAFSDLLPPKTAFLAGGACFLVGLVFAIGLAPNQQAQTKARQDHEAAFLAERLAADPCRPENLPVLLLR